MDFFSLNNEFTNKNMIISINPRLKVIVTQMKKCHCDDIQLQLSQCKGPVKRQMTNLG